MKEVVSNFSIHCARRGFNSLLLRWPTIDEILKSLPVVKTVDSSGLRSFQQSCQNCIRCVQRNCLGFFFENSF